MTTAANKESEHLLAWAFGLLFAASLVIYGVGVYYIQTHLCKQIGPSISMLGVAVSVFASGVLAARALLVRTKSQWLGLVFALLVVAILYFLVGALALPGCSGV